MAALGHFMGALGGSLFQWSLPLVVTLSFLKRGDLYAACVGLFFLGVSLSISYPYMDSAFHLEKYPDMTFVSLGDGDAEHDWQVVFGALGWYRASGSIALAFRAMGLVFIWAGAGLGSWLLAKIILRRKN